MNRISISCAAGALAIAGVWSLFPAVADEPNQKDAAKPSNTARSQPVDKAESAAGVVPECLEILKLSPAQREEIAGIIREYDADIDAVWTQFGKRYRATISMEASLLAAIEDNLTDAQRTQVREERRRVAKHEKTIAGTSSKLNQGTSKPADAVQEEINLPGVSLTDEQESVADKIQEKYLTQLRSCNRDIQGLHTRLVSLEADKLVEIEKVLTKAQLMQLRESRQTAPAAPANQVSSSESKNAE
jgi:hypothetical protein